MSFNLNETIQDILIDCCRTSFINNEDFPYIDLEGGIGNPDLDNTQINFYRSFPKVQSSYPIVLVNPPRIPNLIRTMGGDFMMTTFGSRDVGETSLIQGACFESYGGVSTLDFTLDIIANTEPERDRIADYIIEYIRFSHRQYIEDNGIELIEISKQGDTIKNYGNEYLWVTEISLSLFAEWGIQKNVDLIVKDVQTCNISIYGDYQGLSNI